MSPMLGHDLKKLWPHQLPSTRATRHLRQRARTADDGGLPAGPRGDDDDDPGSLGESTRHDVEPRAFYEYHAAMPNRGTGRP